MYNKLASISTSSDASADDERLEQLGRACLALHKISQRPGLVGEAELRQLLQKLVDIIHNELGYPNCQIFLADPTGQELVFGSAAGFLIDDIEQALIEKWRPKLYGNQSVGLIGWVGLNREILNVPNVRFDPRYYNNYPRSVTQAELTVPLTFEDTLLGVLDIQSDQLNAFDERDVEILNFFAGQASFLIHAARPSWGRPADLDILANVSSGVNRALSQEEIGQICLQNIAKSLNASSGEIMVLDPINFILRPLTILDVPPKIGNTADVQASLLIKHVMQSGQPAFLEDLDFYREKPSIARRVKSSGIRSFACLPLQVRQETLGLLFVNYNERHSFNDSEKLLLGILAEQTAAALLNARFTSREQASRRFAQSLARSSQLVSSQVESEAVFQTIITEVTQVLGTPMSSIALLNESGNEIVKKKMIGARHPLQPSQLIYGKGFIGRVAATGKLWQEYDIALLPEFAKHPIRVLEDWHGSIALPIRTGGPNGPVIGVLCTHDTVPREFNSDEIAYLEGLADQAGISVINARNFAALKRERDMYQALLENANDAIYLLDPKTGRILDANRQATRSTGYSFEELRNQFITKICPNPAHANLVATTVEDELDETALKVENIEVIRKDGSRFPASYSTRQVQVGDDSIIIQIVRDMSERFALEQQLARHEQLRVLGQLAAGVAHDFNNLLTGILGVSELLLNGIPHDDERRLLKMVRQSALDGAQMVRRVQLLGPGQEAEMKPTALNDLLKDVLELTKPRWRSETRHEGIAVEVRLDTSPIPLVLGNSSELREVLTNLVFNAVDAMPIGGRLTLRTATQAREVWLTVEDTGIGMSEETKLHLFEPFYTTKTRNGHGLGLSVSNSIIARHNGTIEVESEPGRGSRFTIKLPAVTEVVSDTEPDCPPAIATLRILVIDDDPNLLYVLTRFLETDNHIVSSTSQGAEAIRLFSKQPEAFDLVITDLSIHDLSGWEIARQIKKCRLNIPIVLITGWAGDLDTTLLKQADIAQVINKPYRFDDVQNTIRQLFSPVPTTI